MLTGEPFISNYVESQTPVSQNRIIVRRESFGLFEQMTISSSIITNSHSNKYNHGEKESSDESSDESDDNNNNNNSNNVDDINNINNINNNYNNSINNSNNNSNVNNINNNNNVTKNDNSKKLKNNNKKPHLHGKTIEKKEKLQVEHNKLDIQKLNPLCHGELNTIMRLLDGGKYF
eukprot:Pgem_evm1s16951